MIKKTLCVFFLLHIASLVFAQNLLNCPESVEWDHVQSCWLVSNYASGEIIAIDSEGNQSIYSDLMSSTLGLKVKDDKLYAASAEGILIFDLNTGYVSSLISIPEAVLLNDLDFDTAGFLFVSDYWDNKIFRIDLSDNSYEVFIDYGIFSPNGMIFDEENNRMLVCGHNGTNSIIHSFDVTTGETELLLYPNFYSLDGFARDSQGNIYISSWYTDTVYKFNGNNIDNNVEIAASGLVDPADIFIDDNDMLAVPNYSDNSISFIQLELPNFVNNGLIEPGKISLSNYPNPFNPSTTITFSLDSEFIENTELSIFNIKGQKIKTLPVILSEAEGRGDCSVVWNGTDNSNNSVSSGIYFSELIINGKIKASNKMILMK